ncbi:MAG: fibronectin type III domain-containing protein [Syntrophobacterales bacterium]|nr:MAG: fibronectin type III domain-containing protein [Syntrophobacterales bacterium]
MGSLQRLISLIALILSLSFSISFAQIERDPKEKNIKNLFFNPKVGLEEIRKAVVLPIRGGGKGLEHARRTVTHLLVANLRAVQKYDILPAQDLKGLVEEKGMDWTKIHHYDQALEIGKSLGVDGVIMGSLSEYGKMGEKSRFAINIRMIRIPEGDTVWSMSCSTRGKQNEMEKIAKGGIESIIRTLVHRWQSGKATIAWGIKLQPLEASGGYRHITLRVPEYGETEIKEYIVSRATSESGPYKKIKRLSMKRRASLSFKDRNVQADGTYFYRYLVRTKNGFKSPLSETVCAQKKKVPQIPSVLRALGEQARRIPLSWNPNPEKDIKHYIIYRSDDAGKKYKKIAAEPGDKTDFIDTKLTDGTTYYYKIKAVDGDGLESEFSETVSAITKAVPSSPKGLKAERGRGKVIISWEANPEADITRYHIYKKRAHGFKKSGSTQELSYSDENLRDGKTYIYKVTAVDKDGLESPFSREISATTAPK